MQLLHLECVRYKSETVTAKDKVTSLRDIAGDCAVQKAEKRILRGINGKFLAELYRCQTGIGEDNKNLVTT